jgi:hypothetical protein
MKISDIKQLKEGTLSVDVPNEDWLADKIDYARSKGRNSYGVPYMGSTTAHVRGTPPRVRVQRLASLPGMRDEQRNVRKDDLAWLMDYMDKNKRLPPMGSSPDQEYLPYIAVAYNGEAWVNEGNHRIMAAYRLNWPDMPVEIRYFDGGERVKDGPMYPGKIGLGEVDAPKTNEDLNEAETTGWTALEVVESILGKDRVTADDDELVPGMYYVYESNSPPQFEDTEEPGQPGGAIRLRDLEGGSPADIAEAAHEACHAYAHSKSTSGVLYTNEKIINNLAEIWLKKNLSGTALHFALEHILGSKLHYGPDHMPRSVTEAFDQPYPFTWEDSEYGDTDALAHLPDGSNLSIMFNRQTGDEGEEAVQVEFYRNNSQEVTGEGDAQRVFATVITAMQRYIKQHNPAKLTFSASKLLDPTIYYEPDEPQPNPESRAKLYDRLIQRYSRAWGYRAFRADTHGLVIYELSRIKPIVAKPVEEARANPDQNTKYESGMKELVAVAKTIADPENWAISMTSEPKLGINPQVGISEDTPKGIYFYPLDYAVDMARRGKDLPWGDNYPYIQLFQYDRSGEMTQQTEVDTNKLKQALRQYCSDDVIQQAIDEPEYDGTPYWTIYDCLSRLGKSDETNVVRWNKVLRDLGFTSVYDPGKGWIAYNEPTQGVVLDPRIIKQLKTIDNKQQSSVVTPAKIEQAIFESMDMELAANRAWQAYDPDGVKLRAAAKEYAKDPKFKPYMGKPGTEEIYDKASGFGRWGARQLSDEAWAWYRAQQPKTESIVNEGGWASTATQNTVITPRTVAEIIHILAGFEASYNAWQAGNELDTEIKIGKPKGSGTYYRRDLEQDPTREYGDVDVECFIHSRSGVKSAQRITEYKNAINAYCAQSPDFSTDNGTNVIMRTTDGPVQVDLIYTYHEHADWSRVLSPEYRVKGVISTSLTSSIAEALNLSFSSQGIQVKIRNNQPVSFRQSKDTELRTVSTSPETWAQDIYSLYYYLSHGQQPESLPRELQAHGGLKDEQRLSDIVLSIKALATGLEDAGLLGHGALIDITDKRDLIRRVAQIYSAKLEAAENSSKFDKASTPAAVEKAKKTKLMMAKYRNEITKLLLN